MNEKPETNIGYVSPLKKICMTIGQLPTAYLETMSYYEMLVWFVEFLRNQVIPVVNNNSEATKELQELFVKLEDYVNTYFDNLDVQEEINNKLDEMTEDGTLEEIIGNYIEDNVEYIFPKSMNASGDCSIIKYKNKNIVIDTYSTTQWLEIKDFLDNNNVSFIDYLIITHYHADHVGNFMNLLNNGYINQNTIFFMPAETTQFGTANNEAIANYKQLFIDYELNYRTPIEGETVIIENNLKMTFYNCDPVKLDNYYPHSPASVNATSTVTLFDFKNVKALFMGDCTQMAYRRMREEKFIKGRIELFKIGHHGVDTDTDELFVRNISPTYAVQLAGKSDFSLNKFVLSNQMELMNEIGTIIYPSYMQDNYIKFTSNNNMTNIIGLSYQNGGIYRDFDIYVDSSINESDYQDGTETYPFKDIPEACSVIKNYSAKQINIHIADGEYCVSDLEDKRNPRITNIKSNITFIGNANNRSAVILTKGFKINSSNVVIENLTIDISSSHGIEINDSKLSVRNCEIKSDNSSTNSGIFATTSIINVYSTKFANMNVAIALRYGCHIVTNSVTYENINNYLIDNQTSNNIIVYNNSYGENLDKYFDLHNYTNYSRPMLIYSDGGSDFTITSGNFPLQLSRLKAIEIFYRTSSSIYNSTGKIFFPQNKKISIQANNTDTNNVFAIATISLSTNAFTINNQKAVTITDNGTTSVTSGNLFKIVRVVGYVDDEINISN